MIIIKTKIFTDTSQNITSVIAVEKPKNDLMRLAGEWSQADAKEFEESTAIFNVIDEEVWV